MGLDLRAREWSIVGSRPGVLGPERIAHFFEEFPEWTLSRDAPGD